MIATLGALVLGLLVGSAKGSFDTTNTLITQAAAKIIVLDSILGSYGPETKATRETLRAATIGGDRGFLAGGKAGKRRPNEV